jgi:hypothetical protein
MTADHEPTYPDPITMRAGDVLQLGQRDDEYPGWIWCTARDGRAGWVPAAYLDVAGDAGVARRDYRAVELRAGAGEVVVVSAEESGWAWVVNARGEAGWVPATKLTVRR